MFNNLTTEGLEESQDRLGGFRRLDSDAYLVTIKAAYAGVATSSKAQSVTLLVETADGAEYRETLWVTNKDGQNWFRNKDDNTKKVGLAGFIVVDEICLVTTDKGLAAQTWEDKTINVYNPESQKEEPKSVPMAVELIGKKVTLGILKKLVFKQVKNNAGEYVDTAETREENEIAKVFHHPSNLTVPEARASITDAKFYGAWVERNRGNTIDKTKGKGNAQAGKSGRPGLPPTAGANGQKTTSLFGAKH